MCALAKGSYKSGEGSGLPRGFRRISNGPQTGELLATEQTELVSVKTEGLQTDWSLTNIC